ncbi:MAG TPA: PAS domain S-box protein [Roseiflexaceae bacterium]|nr:PAS domain S-box protein [Roseiflexaceae bacterium]
MDTVSQHNTHLEIEQVRERLQTLRSAVDDIDQLLIRAIESEYALRESEERFRLLVTEVQDYAIFMLDVQGFVVTWNIGAQRIKGYTSEEIVGRHFSSFYTPEDRQAGLPARVLDIATQEGHYQGEGWRIRKDGSRFWASVVITALHDATGKLYGFGKVTRDLTERKQNEEALRQSEEQLRLLVEGVRDYAIFMLDPHGTVVSWNTGAQIIKGYHASEIIGHHFSIFYPPEAVQAGKCEQILHVAATEGHYEEESWRVRKDGSRFWANVVITALYDQQGALYGFSKVTRDLTERKRAEEQREQLRLQEQQLAHERETRAHIEALAHVRNEFLTVTAHELRTPVTSLLGYTQLLKRRTERGLSNAERVQHTLNIVMKQALRLDRLTNMLLDLTRLEDQQLVLALQPVDLHVVVVQAVDELQMVSEQHTLSIHADSEPLVVEGDEFRLEQIVYNLLQNAIKYSPAGGDITIDLRREHDQAVLAVTDPGFGIPADELPHVFDRFYRATNVSFQHISGMGIGLYIVKELVMLHGGTIEAQSVAGQGSTFTVTLPLSTRLSSEA